MKIMNKIKIKTESEFLPYLSSHDKALFYFSYKIKIYNDGEKKVQLISRHWDIEDSLWRRSYWETTYD